MIIYNNNSYSILDFLHTKYGFAIIKIAINEAPKIGEHIIYKNKTYKIIDSKHTNGKCNIGILINNE